VFYRNKCFKLMRILVLIGIILFLSTTLIAELTGVELKNILASKDLLSNTTAYKISFIRANQDRSFDPNQGMVYMDCELTCIPEGSFAMKITYNYEHPPVFARPGTRGYQPLDYDEQQNLIVWRSMDKYIIFAPDRNETRTRMKSFFVDPNNQILDKGGVQTSVIHFPTGDRINTYEFNQFQYAIGCGFSRRLGAVTSIKIMSSGLIKVIAQASPSVGPKGKWELTVNPKSNYLVRGATFTQESRDKPSIETTSIGTMKKDGLTIAKYGTYRYSNLLELFVVVTDISKVVGPNKLYQEVLSYINSPLPPGASIVDLRGKKHTMTNVE